MRKLLSLKVIATASAVLVALSIFYYLVIFLPGQARVAQEQIRQEKLQECLKEAENKYLELVSGPIREVSAGRGSNEDLKVIINHANNSLDVARGECETKYAD